MQIRKGILFINLFLAISFLFLGCDKKKNDKKPTDMNNPGMGGQSAPEMTMDVQGAVGVLIVDSNADGGGNAKLHDMQGFYLEGKDDPNAASLVKITEDGEILPALNVKQKDNMKGGGPGIPKVQTIAISPAHEVYLHFERPFMYKNPPQGENIDWGDQSNGYQCQIFKVKGGAVSDLQSGPPEENNLECIDNQHFVDSWQANRNSVFQFDKDSNVYYLGSLPNGGGKMVVYKRSSDGSSTSEVINSNISVNDFLVTWAGGVFYTGQTSTTQKNNDGGGGFFRYVEPNSGGVTEIARDWWNFVYEPLEGDKEDMAIFFGPDPRNPTTASWNSACLFKFNPQGDSAESRIDNVITCGDNIDAWMRLKRDEDKKYGRGFDDGEPNPSTIWKEEFANRCTHTKGQIFAGGGSQISSIKQDSNGKTYVIGKVRKMKSGAVVCNIQVKGPHCKINDVPQLYDSSGNLLTSTTCGSSPGTWVAGDGTCGRKWNLNDDWADQFGPTTIEPCLAQSLAEAKNGDNTPVAIQWEYNSIQYNNVASPLCTSDTDHGLVINESNNKNLWNTRVRAYHTGDPNNIVYPATKFSSDGWQCRIMNEDGTVNNQGGGPDQWTDEYRALALVQDSTKTLKMLSDSEEQALNLWLVNNVPYFSTFNTTKGKYYLKRYIYSTGKTQVLAEDFESYNISEGNDDTQLFYDGLDFNTNSYSFGTMNVVTGERTQKTGLTGTVKTIVILPRTH